MQEIERKWLVIDHVPSEVEILRVSYIKQGYIAIEPGVSEVRIRKTKHADILIPDEENGSRMHENFELVAKSSGGLSRIEAHTIVGANKADTFFQIAGDRVIEKVRTDYDLGNNLIAEVDVFIGKCAGLHIVEVEFPSEEAASAFVPLPWMGTEVTEDARFKNASLALAHPDLIGELRQHAASLKAIAKSSNSS